MIKSQVLEIIHRHHLVLPKQVGARPEDLILADNALSRAVRQHYSTFSIAVGYGGPGTGKTFTCLKIFHDLKERGFVTYIPLRYYKQERGSMAHVLNSEGHTSLVASAVAEALARQQTLSRHVKGVLTNADDVPGMQIEGRKLGEILREYQEKVLYHTARRHHIILLDEFEEGIRGYDDIVALTDIAYTARAYMHDEHGYVGVKVVAVMALVPPPESIREHLQSKYIHEALSREIEKRLTKLSHEHTIPFKTIMIPPVDLGHPSNTLSVLRQFAERSIEIVKQKLHASFTITNIDCAIKLLVNIWPIARWAKDILMEALVEAITAAAGGKDGDLLYYTKLMLKRSLDMREDEDVEKILVEGKWGTLKEEGVPDNIRGFIERVLREVCSEIVKQSSAVTDCEYTYMDAKRERGFVTVHYRIRVLTEEKVPARKRGESTTEKSSRKGTVSTPRSHDIIFWLRQSDITKNTVKSMKIESKMPVVLIMPENVRIKAPLPENIVAIVRLPSPLMYYVSVSTKRAIDAKLSEFYDEVLDGYIQQAVLSLVKQCTRF